MLGSTGRAREAFQAGLEEMIELGLDLERVDPAELGRRGARIAAELAAADARSTESTEMTSDAP